MEKLLSQAMQGDYVLALVLVLLIVIAAFGRSLKVDVKTMTAELKPNGGKSAKDIIHRLEMKLDQHMHKAEQRAKKFKQRLDELENKIEKKDTNTNG